MLKKYNERNSSEMSNRTVAFIPARGGSKGIPYKNIKPFCGKPLIYWTIKAAVDSGIIDTVFVATDDISIKDTVLSFAFEKVEVIERSESSCRDEAPTEEVLLEFARQYDFDEIFLIQATSPLLEGRDLAGAYDLFKSKRADSLLSVVRQKRFIWGEVGNLYSKPANYDPLHRPRRQDWEGYYVENGAFYLSTRRAVIESECRVSGNIALFEMNEAAYFEIDEPSDWTIMEQLKKRHIQEQHNFMPDLKLLISDVDGVLTDAGMYYSSDGEEMKKFNTRDGKGIELLRDAGLKFMILTSENINVVQRRADKLKADYVYMGIKDKKSFLESFFEQNPEYHFNNTAYIGDDVNDLECLKLAAFSAAPNDGASEVIAHVQYVCRTNGGQGCVREVCDLIINTKK